MKVNYCFIQPTYYFVLKILFVFLINITDNTYSD